ncbi:MAG: hypothetical protein JEZ00_06150 [Anaerolineaceae bacterium]|nr:hypothetical protein [Anaerolineaceae bacterium]
MKQKFSDHHILLLAVLLYFPLIFFGYGSDYDSYNVLWTGQYFAQHFDYVPSRVPGFFAYETITFFIDSIGGSLLTNLSSMGMAVLVLYVFMRLCKIYQIPHYRILALIMMVQPYFWVNATCTMDYFFATGFIFLGILQVLRGKYFTAGIAFSLAVGSRLTVSLIAAVILIWFFFSQKENRLKILQTGLVGAFFGLMFYLPSADFAEWKMTFLSASVGGQEYWTTYLRLGRFGYKNIYFWSPLVFAIFTWAAVRLFSKKKELVSPDHGWLPIASIAVVLVMEAFYLYIPTEPSYLLPTIGFWLILAALAFENKPRVLYVMLALVLLSNFVNFNVARPNVVDKATSAVYGLWVEPGYMITDINARLDTIECGYQPCDW